jgi:DNA-binding transcriptional MerR regulator
MERESEQEWLYLLMQAKQMGIPIEEVRQFLKQGSLEDVSYQKSKSKFLRPSP